MKYNETAAELMKYGKKTVINERLNSAREEIKQFSEKYEQDMAAYQMRERYLKASVPFYSFSFLLFSITS